MGKMAVCFSALCHHSSSSQVMEIKLKCEFSAQTELFEQFSLILMTQFMSHLLDNAK